MDPIRLDVRSERATYPVVIGTGLVPRLAELIDEEDLGDDVLLVSCRPVWRRHGRRLGALTRRRAVTLIPDGESAKNLRTVSQLYEAFVRAHLDRGATIVAVGGGVVGDVAGFAAATYLRGVHVVQVPTTLLAQVDSAIGGKTGVNLRAGKNLVGAFHAPAMVVCDPAVLATLPPREFRAGLYEVVKYGVIASVPLFDRLAGQLDAVLARDPAVLAPLIADCCRIKAAVVSVDEREAGPRRMLNFGHTIGHALEAVTKYRRFRHGEAVAWGMLAAARLSVRRGLMSHDDEQRVAAIVRRLGQLPPVADLRATEALRAIAHDKKVLRHRLHFVLAERLGAVTTASDVTTAELRDALRGIGLAS